MGQLDIYSEEKINLNDGFKELIEAENKIYEAEKDTWGEWGLKTLSNVSNAISQNKEVIAALANVSVASYSVFHEDQEKIAKSSTVKEKKKYIDQGKEYIRKLYELQTKLNSDPKLQESSERLQNIVKNNK